MISTNTPVESRLVWTVIEDLQKLTSTEMEHELRINTEIIREPEACRILLSIVRELLAQSDEHPIQPPQNIW